jgi:hypothetical protein
LQEKTVEFRLDRETGYFTSGGVDVIAFEDIYPEGHQGGVSLLMHGERIAANGDVRFEPAPGQWQPVPAQLEREVDAEKGRIVTRLRYPDENRHLLGFNPMVYPDCAFEYTVSVQAEGGSLRITVDADPSLPAEWNDRLCFNLEMFPGLLFSRPWIMDERQGIFPRQPVGPVDCRSSVYTGMYRQPAGLPEGYAGKMLETDSVYSPLRGDEKTAAPYASGRCFVCCPDDPLLRFTVESLGSEIRFCDGRLNHNNGWFVLSSPFSASGPHAVEWILTPHTEDGWISPPRIQVSQVGYMPLQPKVAVAELDRRDTGEKFFTLWQIERNGKKQVFSRSGAVWGRFLRYNCLCLDFSEITEPGLYRIECGGVMSSVFRIAPDIFDRGVWQPVLEYFLPVQMCHMKVNEKYRVWHGRCHLDDARMAPVNWNHFDGYRQGQSTLTRFAPGQCVPGLNCGGWHDAGDFDLRVESQSGEAYLLSLMYEAFHVEWDSTMIDQQTHTVEIHHPDGKNDLLQQVEHGALAVLGGWKALGRLFRGIIAANLRQYVMLGDAAAMTDGVPGGDDDRWVFTEDNPARELTTAAHLAAVSRALAEFNPSLASDALEASRALFSETRVGQEPDPRIARVHAAAELFLSTGENIYAEAVLEETELIVSVPDRLGWIAARIVGRLGNEDFTAALRESLLQYWQKEEEQTAHSPYGVPYRPHIWGAGWIVQRLGCEHYYLHKAFPDIFTPDLCCNALSFVLGCHPGRSVSFASGIGAESVTAAYGFNRADASYIPGGVVSGTALIRPDFPELKEWPFLWQQTEYVLGGGSSRFMFLVLAVRALMQES